MTETTPPYRYVDGDSFCLSARLLPDLNTGGVTDTLSITIEGSDEPQSVHVPAGDVSAVAAGIVAAAGQQPAATVPAPAPTDRALRHERYATAMDAVTTGHVPDLLDAILAVADAEQAELRRERDLAVAHDRQPYPTAWAYEQACKALRRKTAAIERLLAFAASLDDIARKTAGPDAVHPVAAHLRDQLVTLTDEDEQADAQPEFTEARTAFMQIGRTPSLEGLRAELHIEGHAPLVGRYCGAAMGRMHDVPGHEHLLAVDPRLIFEYAEQPAAARQAHEGPTS